jgi:hypothetical protein
MEKEALEESPAPSGTVLVTRTVPPGVGWASRTRAAARRASGEGEAVAPWAWVRGISHGSGNWSEWMPTRKLAGSGVKVAWVARSMAMGSDRPWL